MECQEKPTLALSCSYTHRFSRPRCCSTSPSHPRFENPVRYKPYWMCMFILSDFLGRGFLPVSQKRHIKISSEKPGCVIRRVVRRVVRRVNFFFREARTTPRKTKSVRVATDLDRKQYGIRVGGTGSLFRRSTLQIRATVLRLGLGLRLVRIMDLWNNEPSE